MTTSQKSRKPKTIGTSDISRNESRDSVYRSEGIALVRTYAIRAKEKALAPDVITGIFTLHDTTIIAWIDPGSMHSYICTTLSIVKKMPILSIEVDVRVSNLINKWVLVNEIC